MQNNEAHLLCANAARALAVSAIEHAQSGHPGVALGFADVLTVLWRQHMRYDLVHPNWQNRDRFVLSNGHASALYYAILHCCGFDVSLEDMKQFRKIGSKTPGHPERDENLGIDVTTGPLGQGLANAVGLAIAESHMRHQLPQKQQDLIDYFTYVAVGDGCLMEGISHEAASLAGRFGLGKLIVCWDDNGISIDGQIDQWAERSVADRFKSYGWQVIEAVDGHCPYAIDQAISDAKLSTDQPSLICFRTNIGLGTDLVGSSVVHGKPLGRERFMALKKSLNCSVNDFEVPEIVYSLWQAQHVTNLYDQWASRCCGLSETIQRQIFMRSEDTAQQSGWADFWEESCYEKSDFIKGSRATRHSSQEILQQLLGRYPGLIGGSADLSESTGVLVDQSYHWDPDGDPGPFIHFGVREFAMFAIANGLAACFRLRPFVSTFLVFSDYGINAVRMAALMKLPVIFIFSHDSVYVGEDGPTHQPIEHLSHLRSIPNLEVWRPADGYETATAWQQMLAHEDGPSCLVLSRQKLVSLATLAHRASAHCGASRLDTCADSCDGVLIASGSEVALVVEVSEKLFKLGIKVAVVSMLCMDRFLMQSAEIQKRLLPQDGFRLIVEAGSAQCWYQFLAGPGIVGEIVSIDHFGDSGEGRKNYLNRGFHADNLCRSAVKLYNIVAAKTLAL